MFINFIQRVQSNRTLRWRLFILLGMYSGYAAIYMCRATVVTMGPAMLADPTLGLTKTAWGALLGWGGVGTLVGKLINGVLVDKLGGRKIFLFSMALCILATSAFGLMSELTVFSVAYFLTLFSKSAGWPSMANLISRWYPVNWRGGVWGVLSSSSRMSSIFTSLVLGSLLLYISWRGVIGIAITITTIFMIVLYYTLKQSPSEVGLNSLDIVNCDNSKKPHSLHNSNLAEALLDFVRSPRVWLISLSMMCLTVLMEFQSFIPIYLQETFGLTSGIAAMTSAAFPIGCLISVLGGGFIFDLLSKKNRIFVLGGMMLLSVICLNALLAIPKFYADGPISLWSSLFFILLFGLAIAPCYYIPMSVFSIDYGGKHCGVLIGIIDAIGYAGAIVFDFYGGAVSDEANGWNKFLYILVSVSLLGFVALTMFLVLEYKQKETPKATQPENNLS